MNKYTNRTEKGIKDIGTGYPALFFGARNIIGIGRYYRQSQSLDIVAIFKKTSIFDRYIDKLYPALFDF